MVIRAAYGCKSIPKVETGASDIDSTDEFSPLLELPAELRNHVYEAIMEDEAAYLAPRSKGHLATSVALPRVNRQLREEFLSYVYLKAPKTVATVQNFDFRHIVTFFNRLSDKELKGLSAVKQLPASRKLVIELELGPIPARLRITRSLGFIQVAVDDFPSLRSWLKRSEVPTKKGTTVDITYVVIDGPGSDGWPDIHCWERNLEQLELILPANGLHQKRDLLKIVTAVKAAREVHKD